VTQDPTLLSEAVEQLLAAADRLAAQADLVQVTDRLTALAERMEEGLPALEAAPAHPSRRPESSPPTTGSEHEGSGSASFQPRDENTIRVRSDRDLGERDTPGAGSHDWQRPSPPPDFAFTSDPEAPPAAAVPGGAPASVDRLEDELAEVEPRGLFELESARSFADERPVPARTRTAASVIFPPTQANPRPRPAAGRRATRDTAPWGRREALEMAALGIGDSEATEPRV
jgi:hypothetical protein